MKKKQLIYFLTLTITAVSILASCGKSEAENSQKPSDQAQKAETADGKEADNKDSAGKEAEAAGSAADALSGKGPTSSKTDKGASIKVDYSKYKKKENQNLYTRMQDAWIPDLKADSGYGRIYPFTGSAIYEKESEYGNPVGYIYGMIDEKGRIIADPTYAEIRAGEFWDSEKHVTVPVPIWILTRAEGTYNGYGDLLDGVTYNAVATMDGSFATECKYRYVDAGEYGFTVAETYDSPQFTTYDFKGNILFTEKDVSIPGITAGMIRDYSDGIFNIYTGNGNYYMDATGKTVLGPYSDGTDFHCGRAYVNKNGNYCYIDHSGKTIANTGSEWISSGYTFDLAEIRPLGWEGPADIIDVNGKVILHTASNYVKYSEKLICCIFDQEQRVECYDHKGKKLNEYRMENIGVTEKGTVVYGEKDGKTYVINMLTGAQTVIDDVGVTIQGIMYRNSMDFESDDSFIVAIKYDENYENSDNKIYRSEDMKQMDEAFEYVNLMVDPITGDKYLVYLRPDDSQKVVSIQDGSSYTEKAGTDLYVYNGRHLAFDDTSCRYHDADRKLLFNFVQVNSLGD